MLHTLAKRMASITLQRSLGEQEKQNVLTYGYELLFSQTFTCFCILVIAFGLGCFLDAIFFLGSFIAIRIWSGGFHARTFAICFISSVGISLLAIGAEKAVCLAPSVWLIVLLLLLANGVFFFKGPFLNTRHPLPARKVQENRKKLWATVCVENVVCVLFSILEQWNIAYIISFGEVAAAILLVMAVYMKSYSLKGKEETL